MSDDVFVRTVCAADRNEFVTLMKCSKSLHEPWISPPTTERAFDAYLTRMSEDDHHGLVVCRRIQRDIVGVININSIVRGTFLSASLGYYVGAPYVGRGLMSQGLQQAVAYAFGPLGLHRVEANIQPDNARSLALVSRCGFRREGFSPGFLYIAGQWRDHERWAIYDERASLPTSSGKAN